MTHPNGATRQTSNANQLVGMTLKKRPSKLFCMWKIATETPYWGSGNGVADNEGASYGADCTTNTEKC